VRVFGDLLCCLTLELGRADVELDAELEATDTVRPDPDLRGDRALADRSLPATCGEPEGVLEA
jgi:hypothetical protein